MNREPSVSPRFTAPSAKILAVDDLAANIRFLKELMSPCLVKTYASLSGARAIEMIQKERYDLVFMDILMPEIDGLETISRIRSLGAGRTDDEGAYFQRLPIVLLSANEIDERDEALARIGVSDCMVKPIVVAKLFDILERLLPAEKVVPRK